VDLVSFQKWVTHPFIQAGLVVVMGWLVGVIMERLGIRLIGRAVSKTKTIYDDQILEECKAPIRTSILLWSLWIGTSIIGPMPQVAFIVKGLLTSWALFIWTRAFFSISSIVLKWLSSIPKRFGAVTPRTVPAWEMTSHLLLTVITAYFFFLCWDFDVTGWLASAGIVGVAVGFGAKDTMSNLFAGVGILADNTYRLGDFLLLDTGERGRVTDIGLRSTRLLTLDEMEIIVPNSAMATAKIINESGGPTECERIHINVSVAYGSNVDEVRALLLDVAQATEGVMLDDPRRSPSVMFVRMGDFALQFKLNCYISLPEQSPRVIDGLNTGVYNALNAAKIEIPYPKQDVFVRQSD
jgi:MscS family membrane protein